ncbi:helix-turn-helix domain-containing protein [Paenibacillus sp. ALJ109b]|uniref:helix-turn-helix domain-containing protein n=1 Tax=Paenibacillus sp. ALJ109b TaxID=2709068 RepID=UPI0013D4E411|nr:helix-turn-helix domain-containing protein [Paenibacillus sp. ALJ109b]NEU60518.1 helix-turn-helix domain-containing protein [Paenibacillus sp. ALJ109b]
MNKKYEIRLEPKEREWIEQLLHAGSTSPGIRRRCLVLLLSNENQGVIPKQTEIASRSGVSKVTVYYTVKDDCTRGLDQTLHYRRRDEPARPSPITGEVDARIISLAYSVPPKGYARWTIRLLTRRELNILESVGRETIRTTLKNKT